MESKPAPDLKAIVLDYFAKGQFDDAVVVASSADKDYVNDQAWDLVPAVCEFLTGEKEVTQPDLITACEDILNHIASVANVKELLIVLLEQADSFKDDVKFKALLQPIQKCLMHLPGSKTHSIGIAMETLYAHIKNLPLPDDQNFEGKERILLDLDEKTKRCCEVTLHFLKFVTPVVEEVSWKRGQHENRKKDPKLVMDLTKYLIHVLHYPMSYLDLTYRDQEPGESRPPPKSGGRICAEKAISLLAHLQANFPRMVIMLLEENEQIESKQADMDKKCKAAEEKGEEFDKLENYCVEESTPMLGLSTFCYLAFGEQLDSNSIPQVLAPRYYIEINCIFVSYLLDQSENLIMHKGLLLLSKLEHSLPDESFDSLLLETGEVKDLIYVLVKVMTSSKVKELSQIAVGLLKDLVKKFDIPGRNQFLLYLLRTTNHSGLTGYVVNLLKDEIDCNLKRNTPDPSFIGSRLWRLLDLVFMLPSGEKTDLLENSDRIMAALNILRYLVIRDKPIENVTGIWDQLAHIRDRYCEILHKGIELSRVHYELELKKTKEKRTKSGPEISFDVSGRPVGMNKKQELFAIEMALHTFDMMESILGRVTELIDQQDKVHLQTDNVASD